MHTHGHGILIYSYIIIVINRYVLKNQIQGLDKLKTDVKIKM